MPTPAWADLDYDPLDQPNVGVEILGRGSHARKSKTFLKDQEIATLLGFIRGYCRMLSETFRRLHAQHYTTEQSTANPDGTITTRTVPEVLTDAEIQARYPIVAEWERLHQEQVDHYASIAGFSVRAAAGLADPEQRKRHDSSAGTDHQKRNGATATNERWK